MFRQCIYLIRDIEFYTNENLPDTMLYAMLLGMECLLLTVVDL